VIHRPLPPTAANWSRQQPFRFGDRFGSDPHGPTEDERANDSATDVLPDASR
jgi:hypothetical protein